MSGSPPLAALLQAFFTDRLRQQRQASPHTVAAYRDTFRLLLHYAHKALGKPPVALGVTDLQVPLITAFLQHIECERRNSPRTRNVRLAAIHSFFRYVSFSAPECALLCQQILAIPSKRYDRKPIAYLSHDEIQALVAAPDTTTWIGWRDRVLLLIAAQTGLRVSELIALRRRDIALDVGAHVQCCGKGRKLRATPLRPEAVHALRHWLRELPDDPDTPAFPSRRGTPLSRDAVERLVTRHARTAAARCPSLQHKRVTPHALRHSAAMALLQHGVDRSVIALWLGHESVETTQIYLHADIAIKQKALAACAPIGTKNERFRPNDQLLAFLEAL